MRNLGYFHHATLHEDAVVFVCEDDLWSVPAGGGPSIRLTANPGDVATPTLSPDGSRLAFTSRDELHAEVFVMDADGGPATRLTWLGGTAVVKGWTPDGRIVFTSDAGEPFATLVHSYALDDAAGAHPERLPFGPVRNVSFQIGGPGVVIGR